VQLLMFDFLLILLPYMPIIFVECISHPCFGAVCLWCMYYLGRGALAAGCWKVAFEVFLSHYLLPELFSQLVALIL